LARTRKTPENGNTGTQGSDSDSRIEDAEVVAPAAEPSPSDSAEGVQETAPEAEPAGEPPDAVVDSGEMVTVAQDPEPAEDAPPVEDPQPAPDSAEDRVEEEHPAADPPPAEEAVKAPREEPPRPAPPPPAHRSGAGLAVAVVFGGIIAALAGVGAARFVFPEGWPGQGDTVAEIAALQSALADRDARLAELDAALAGLRDEVGGLPDPAAAVAAAVDELRDDVGARIDTAATESLSRIGSVEDDLATLAARLEDLALRPMPEGFDTDSLDAELQVFRQELSDAVEAARGQIVGAQEEAAAIAARAAEEAEAREQAAAEEAEALRTEAERAAGLAARDTAIARIRAAVDSGEPYAADLSALDDVPPALAGPAASGVPTLAALVEGFPRRPAPRSMRRSARPWAGSGNGPSHRLPPGPDRGEVARAARRATTPTRCSRAPRPRCGAATSKGRSPNLRRCPRPGRPRWRAGWMAARTRLDAVCAARALAPN
jgi:hypothetical protein